jgi:hypothetical protein
MASRAFAALLTSLLAALGVASPAGATYPAHAFRVSTADGTDQLYTVRPDGHGLRQITSGNGGDEADCPPMVAIGPDDTHLHRILGFSSFKPRNIDWGPR